MLSLLIAPGLFGVSRRKKTRYVYPKKSALSQTWEAYDDSLNQDLAKARQSF